MKHPPVLYLLAASLSVLAGCTKPPPLTPSSIPPTVRLTHAPFEDGSAYFYAYRMNWIGYDPDGRVEYFEYAVDPPANEEAIEWRQTTKNEEIIFFSATTADEDDLFNPATDFHTFAIRATDNDGNKSDVTTRSFFSYTVAPTVNIVNPQPHALLERNVSPSVRITWTGTDPDGQFTTKPVKYKYLLITPSSEFPMNAAVTDPDSLRRRYAPDFAGWDSTTADSAEARYTHLNPGSKYVFAVVAFDEAGAYSPIFSLSTNVLRFNVGFAGNLGPTITIYTDAFYFEYPSGGYTTDPRREIFMEGVEDRPITFNWFAEPNPGARIEGYRWALDIVDVADETPRTDPNDVTHWSDLSLLTTSATVGPFTAPATHRFYVEARDNNGLRSLGIVRIEVAAITAEKQLLVVDDTRFLADQYHGTGTCPAAPTGEWPSAAELDTFLFARGGVPWRCCGAATQTEPGLFAGYSFDTLGTRTGSNDASVRLSELGRYEHVVWITDARSATNMRPGSDPFNPMSSLRYMSVGGRFNSLAAYARQGGKVWLAGGGGAAATLYPWDSPDNDRSTWSNAQGELIPGRFMYDLAAWRSEIKVTKAPLFIQRHLGRNEGRKTWPEQPNYAVLPATLRGKSAAGDVFPPCRPGQSPTVFYRSAFDVEYLSLSNFLFEDFDPDPDREDFQSGLDTLYRANLYLFPPTTTMRATMTYRHGPLDEHFVFTGFSLWDFTRADCQALVDFVLQDIWGLSRTAPAGPPMTRAVTPVVDRAPQRLSRTRTAETRRP